MKKIILMIVSLIILAFFLTAYAEDKQAGKITGKHKEAGLSCSDCHKEKTPSARPSQKVCRDCHSDMTDTKSKVYKDIAGHEVTFNPHYTHTGSMRCTLCHKMHSTSELYCNTGCHHKFQVKVP